MCYLFTASLTLTKGSLSFKQKLNPENPNKDIKRRKMERLWWPFIKRANITGNSNISPDTFVVRMENSQR